MAATCSIPTTFAAAETGKSPPANGQPYVLEGTQVWSVPDSVSGRRYEVFVSLPPGYGANGQRHYPVLYVADADYGFPLIRSITRRINLEGAVTEDFILVGLSYAKGEDGAASRRRDYTPTARGPRSAPKNAMHGGGAEYQRYLRDEALPFIEKNFRADPARRVFMGHSYGALLGAQILLSEPRLFRDYILGSPSFWYDDRAIMKFEAAYASAHRDLTANVFMYVGAFEAMKPGDRRYSSKVDMVKDLRLFERSLRSRNYPGLRIVSQILPDENHLTVFPSGFTRGLIHMLPIKGRTD